MNITDCIKEKLFADYFISFDVASHYDSKGNIYEISPTNSDGTLFKIKVSIQEIRLTATLEPDKYGADFVRYMGKTDCNKKEQFFTLWNLIDNEAFVKTKLRINDNIIQKTEFLDISTDWQKFCFELKKSPYFENENDKITIIIDKISKLCGMALSLSDYEIQANNDKAGYSEGSEKYIQSKKYERNMLNRKICILEKGYTCAICGFNFEKAYGDIGKNFIHVHHTTPVSQMGENYIVNPRKELYPVCPNCHAMLHKSDPPLTIEELKEIIDKQN